jgi:hypothetical protein
VDLERGVVFLSDSKTGAKTVYLSAAALAVLVSLPRIHGNPHIVPGEKAGAPRMDLKKPWAALKRAAKLDGVRIHDLRHSFASVGAGASLGRIHPTPGLPPRLDRPSPPSRRATRPVRRATAASWRKPKCLDRQEFVIVGWTDPEGSRLHLGALLLGYYTDDGRLSYAGRVGACMPRQLEAMQKRP